MTTETTNLPKEKMIIDFDLGSDETFADTEHNYRFVNHPNDPKADYRCVEILYGDFSGLVYRYGRFKIGGKDNPDETRTVQYEYDVIDVPDKIKGVQCIYIYRYTHT